MVLLRDCELGKRSGRKLLMRADRAIAAPYQSPCQRSMTPSTGLSTASQRCEDEKMNCFRNTSHTRSLSSLPTVLFGADIRSIQKSESMKLGTSRNRLAQNRLLPRTNPRTSTFGRRFFHHFHPTMSTDERALLKPAARVAGRKQDVWYVPDSIVPLN